ISDHPLMNGLTAARTAALSEDLSNASGAGVTPRCRRMSAAWRASTCTIDPAAASTSGDEIDGAAPLYALTPVSSNVFAYFRNAPTLLNAPPKSTPGAVT